MRTIFTVLVGVGLIQGILSQGGFCQVSITTDNSSPDASAMLDIKSTQKGILIPRMTQSQRTGISSPALGLLVFQTDGQSGYYYFTGSAWIPLIASGPGYIGNLMDIDGNIYHTLRIGTQEWMMENLKTAHYRNGEIIQNISDNTEWSSLTSGARCYYDNDSTAYAGIYGSLYNFYALEDSRGICPAGWHIPSTGEWLVLTTFLGGTPVAGGKVKAARYWISPNNGELNASGFSGIPHGHRFSDGSFDFNGTKEVWWTSTRVDATAVYYRCVINNSAGVFIDGQYNTAGLSVRCIKD